MLLIAAGVVLVTLHTIAATLLWNTSIRTLRKDVEKLRADYQRRLMAIRNGLDEPEAINVDIIDEPVPADVEMGTAVAATELPADVEPAVALELPEPEQTAPRAAA